MIDYERKKEDARRRMREATIQSQEIAPMPKVVDVERRKRTSASFKSFCETYFSDVFYLGWSDIHLKVIAKIERVIKQGEIYALAMPRGSGKTTLNQLAVLWAAMTGKTEFVVLIAANATRADSLLEDIKLWLETNDLLLEDYPEICYPIRRLEHISHRQRGQTYKGVHTRINWKAGNLVFPTVKGSKASGAIIMTAGMSGSDIRGLSYTRSDGKKIRPSLAFVDDPQTRESAQSETQCDDREKIIKADILGMSGPGKKLACCITMTVVAENDVAQRLLDKSKNPEFHGERYQLLDAYPENQSLWEDYRQIRESELQSDGDGSQATEFYQNHRDAMDKGAIATWKDRFNDDEISAIQYAMNLKFRDEQAFQSEYQNLPVESKDEGGYFDLSFAPNILSGYDRNEIPIESTKLTAFIDVHKNLLYYAICAWSNDFSGAVIDYGTYPKQRRLNFTLNDAKPTLLDSFGATSLENAVYKGLDLLTISLLNKTYITDGGAEISIDKLLIDANWGATTDLVYSFISDSPFRQRILPSHGQFIGATSKPFSELKYNKGDIAGTHWRIPANSNHRRVKHILIDTNYWKSFVYNRLTTQVGERSRLTLNGELREHSNLLSHLAAEYFIPVEARGKRVDEWKLRQQRPDNHWFDCLVGCAAGASTLGVKLPSGEVRTVKPRVKRVSFSSLQKKRLGNG